MSRILSTHFRTYLAGLEKMQTAVALQTDVLGVPDQSMGGGGGGAAAAGVAVLTGLFNKAVARATTVRRRIWILIWYLMTPNLA